MNFSGNVDVVTRNDIREILNVSEVQRHEKYLGLPTMIGRTKKSGVCRDQGENLEEGARVEAEAPFPARKESATQNGDPSNPDLCDEHIQIPRGAY